MIHFDVADDVSLKSMVVDREKVNARIRQLQAVRHERVLPTGGWDFDLLMRVVSEGLDVLSDVQLDWLFDNPVALFMLHDQVMDDGGSYWYGD
jgi:hypothetical protein